MKVKGDWSCLNVSVALYEEQSNFKFVICLDFFCTFLKVAARSDLFDLNDMNQTTAIT